MFNSILSNSTTSLSLKNATICLIISLVTGLIISFTHMKTTKYSKSFVTTLFLLPALVQVIIMLVNGSLGTSVAIVGAFSLVRFRSLPGNSKEILSILFAMTIGLAIGVGYVWYALIITIIICLVIVLLDLIKFGENSANQILKIIIPEDLDYEDVFDEILAKYTNNYTLDKVKTTNMGSLYELTYAISLKERKESKGFIDELRCRNSNLKISLERPVETNEL